MNYDRCISCKASRAKSKELRYFRFPKDDKRCKEWILACNLESLLSVPTSTMYKKYRICSQHFEVHDYANTRTGRLKSTACPSKFGPFENSLISQLKGSLRNKLSVMMPLESVKGDLLCRKEDRVPDSSDSEFFESEIDSNEMETNNSALLDASMNERFYSPEQLKTLTNSLSKSSNSQSKGCDIPENKIQLKEKLQVKMSLKALKKQWLDAEVKAATAKRDYYETKKVMLAKLQKDIDLENSSDFQMSTALQNIKVHLKKEDLASKIEKKMLKQQLEEAKVVANYCEKGYYEPELVISISDDDM